jgi:prepilin-type N-terminal cleavage/methylation domain-containing protein
MISTTTRFDRRARRRAFTLVEVMIGATIGSMLLLGVLTSFLMLGRSGANAANYATAENKVRRGLEVFSQDVRMAYSTTWPANLVYTGATGMPNAGLLCSPVLVFGIPGQGYVSYVYDTNPTSPTYQSLYKIACEYSLQTPSTPKQILVTNITSLAFVFYNRTHGPATSFNDTKLVELTMNVLYTRATLVGANTNLVSASFTMRNKTAN